MYSVKQSVCARTKTHPLVFPHIKFFGCQNVSFWGKFVNKLAVEIVVFIWGGWRKLFSNPAVRFGRATCCGSDSWSLKTVSGTVAPSLQSICTHQQTQMSQILNKIWNVEELREVLVSRKKNWRSSSRQPLFNWNNEPCFEEIILGLHPSFLKCLLCCKNGDPNVQIQIALSRTEKNRSPGSLTASCQAGIQQTSLVISLGMAGRRCGEKRLRTGLPWTS